MKIDPAGEGGRGGGEARRGQQQGSGVEVDRWLVVVTGLVKADTRLLSLRVVNNSISLNTFNISILFRHMLVYSISLSL